MMRLRAETTIVDNLFLRAKMRTGHGIQERL